jgi:hypothetical protein
VPDCEWGLDCQWAADDEPVSIEVDLPAEPDRQPEFGDQRKHRGEQSVGFFTDNAFWNVPADPPKNQQDVDQPATEPDPVERRLTAGG